MTDARTHSARTVAATAGGNARWPSRKLLRAYAAVTSRARKEPTATTPAAVHTGRNPTTRTALARYSRAFRTLSPSVNQPAGGIAIPVVATSFRRGNRRNLILKERNSNGPRSKKMRTPATTRSSKSTAWGGGEGEAFTRNQAPPKVSVQIKTRPPCSLTNARAAGEILTSIAVAGSVYTAAP
jgi:hypothetical protein